MPKLQWIIRRGGQLLRRVQRSQFGRVLLGGLQAVTPLGWLLLGVLLGAWLLYDKLGWAEFQVLAIAAAILWVIAIVMALWGGKISAKLELVQPRVQVGDTGYGAVWLSAAKPASALVELPVGEAIAEFRVSALRTGQDHLEQFQVPTSRRGVIKIGAVRSVKGDPLGVIAKVAQLAPAQELFVHPRVVPLGTDAIGFLKDVEGVTTAKLSSSDVSFHALREYAPGDDRRAIHWRTTARTEKLMVRQFEETMRAHLVIVLSTLRADYASAEDFEIAVSTAGSLGISAFGQERQVSIWTSQGELAFVSAMTMLDALSRVELSDAGDPLIDTVVQAANSENGISVAALLSGNVDPLALRAAALAIPPSVRAFAVRHDASAPPARRSVGDLVVIDLASLDDLALSVRSV